MPGFTFFPGVGSVEHELPSYNVTLYSARFGDVAQARIVGLDEIVYTYDSVGGSIVIPQAVFDDALTNRSKLTLTVAGVQTGGYIQFLPRSESEDYPFNKYININGQAIDSAFSVCTDYVSIDGVVEMVVTADCRENVNCLAAYDGDKNFIRIILGEGTFDSVHVIPDGSYSFVRSCSINSSDHSLMLYFRDRRRKTNKKDQHE